MNEIEDLRKPIYLSDLIQVLSYHRNRNGDIPVLYKGKAAYANELVGSMENEQGIPFIAIGDIDEPKTSKS